MSAKRLLKSGGNVAAQYAVEMRPVCKIRSSPENDILYGKVDPDTDASFAELVASIREHGLIDPLLLTTDGFILSGHRRFAACVVIGMIEVPVRVKAGIAREGNPDFARHLAAFNPQRVKSPAALFKEALLRFKTDEEAIAAITHWEEDRRAVIGPYHTVTGKKGIATISEKRREFLDAVKAVVERLKPYWPLTLRQIHYQLLNDPPMTLTPARSSFDLEQKYRYRNDAASYQKLSELCVPARYRGEIPMESIDDLTRPHEYHRGFDSTDDFIRNEMEVFLTGYHRDMQQDQPLHIEVFGEKNTLLGILKPVCRELNVPLTIGRGFCSVPVWRDMAARFKESEKKEMVLLVASDFDPEGFELADDAIRSLALWGITAHYHRVAVDKEQIDALGLAADFNPAKESSSRYKKFVERTGATKTWEIEALPPDYLQRELKEAILSRMDVDLYNKTARQEQADALAINRMRHEFAASMGV